MTFNSRPEEAIFQISCILMIDIFVWPIDQIRFQVFIQADKTENMQI